MARVLNVGIGVFILAFIWAIALIAFVLVARSRSSAKSIGIGMIFLAIVITIILLLIPRGKVTEDSNVVYDEFSGPRIASLVLGSIFILLGPIAWFLFYGLLPLRAINLRKLKTMILTFFGIILFPIEFESIIKDFSEDEKKMFRSNKDYDPHRIMIKALNKIDTLMIFRIIYIDTFKRIFRKELEMEKLIKNDPSIVENPVKNPVFLIGLPRTGTTLLHNLLHLDPRLKIPLNYELMFFSMYAGGAKEDDPLFHKHTEDIKMFTNCLAPSFTQVHDYSAGEPEECHTLFEQAGISFEIFSIYPDNAVYEYNKYMIEVIESLELQKQLYNRYEKLVQVYLRYVKDQNVRYVAKSRLHNFYLEALIEKFPDAKFVVTHRSMQNVVPSWSTLYDVVNREDWRLDFTSYEIARKCMYHLKHLSGKAIENRKKLEERGFGDRFTDISYTDLVKDPINEMKKVYKQINLEWTDECESRIKNYMSLSKQKRKKVGVKKYTLSQFKLSPQQIDNEFRHYTDFLEERNIKV
ncbi:DgyrCDS10852 [Dimorphilus gyrociliatus]|uniref:DgyrCDS10852 n=1 Tax=Dimorphilus gyrociliatus TaxID=2664684 RepID=A0A7I8W1K0_9ANNE|nr:DgyrCDS10852 [Dimorphilus gyrociliatus]